MATYICLLKNDNARGKEVGFLDRANYHHANQCNFSKIPGSPILYSISTIALSKFDKSSIDEHAILREGIHTGENAKYLRQWHEVSRSLFSAIEKTQDDIDFHGKKWVPYNKGGTFRRWYGNNDLVIAFNKKQRDQMAKKTTHVRPSQSLYFKNGGTWSSLSMGKLAVRYYPSGFLFDSKGQVVHERISGDLPQLISFMNSCVADLFFQLLMPTLDYKCGDVKRTPYIKLKEESHKDEFAYCVSCSKAEWDSHETSWDYARSPLLNNYSSLPIETKFDEYLVNWYWPSVLASGSDFSIISQVSNYKKNWTELLHFEKEHEQRLNNLFIDLYGLSGELAGDVPYDEITLLQDELVGLARKEGRIEFHEEVLAVQFVSYGVGCIMGRYSAEMDGLILANAGNTIEDFKTKIPTARFLPDEDGILPLTDEDDFSDDLPTAFKSWLRFISGAYYDANLRWIEERLGKDLRSFFDRDFNKDHIKRYKSRPIYWMVSSPSSAFRALIYLHRYTKDTVGKILNDYVRPYRTKVDQKIRGLESIIDSSSTSAGEKTKAKKRLAQLEKYRTEIEAWEKESLYPLALKRVELDLDDGVKVNYRKLEGILEPVKQLEGKEEE